MPVLLALALYCTEHSERCVLIDRTLYVCGVSAPRIEGRVRVVMTGRCGQA